MWPDVIRCHHSEEISVAASRPFARLEPPRLGTR
jgi:hypothetical protein